MDLFDDDDDDDNVHTKRPTNCGVLAFHNGTEQALIVDVERHAGNTPEDVLRVIDSFCYKRHWMMHIGDVKGKILIEELEKLKRLKDTPLVCVEIGSYCGYSSVLIAGRLRTQVNYL